MPDFESLFEEDDFANISEEVQQATTQTTAGASMGPAELKIKEDRYTHATYTCYKIPCKGEGCSEPILYLIDPQYAMRLGMATGIPLEIAFSPHEGEVVEGFVKPWSKHSLASKNVWQCVCPKCETLNQIAQDHDGGFVTGDYDDSTTVQVPVPVNRVYYIENSMEHWDRTDVDS